MPRPSKYPPELIERGVRLALESERHPTDIASRDRSDRVWRTRSQLELAIVEYIAWFNDTRLHENLDDPGWLKHRLKRPRRPTKN
jgi:hypothetical protein